jgi:hypothetical protein
MGTFRDRFDRPAPNAWAQPTQTADLFAYHIRYEHIAQQTSTSGELNVRNAKVSD